MAKKLETIVLVASLEKAARKTGAPLWADLAKRLNGVSRNKVAVNLDKLSEMAEKNKGKTLLVPGKILSNGELTAKTSIVAVSASEAAKEKMKGKAEFATLKEFVQKGEKAKLSDVIIVK